MSEFKNIAVRAGNSINILINFLVGLTFSSLAFSVAIGLIDIIFLTAIFPVILVFFIRELFSNKDYQLDNVAVGLLGFIYISVPIGMLHFLIFPGFPSNNQFFPWILMGTVLTLWMYDSGAYFSGTMLGKHKLMPVISPRKSWEGVIGGGIFAMITSLLAAVFLGSSNLKLWIGIGVIVILFGTLGDLFESFLKRSVGIKDSGNILPGHGGLLDRMDSLLFVVPPVFIWILISSKI